MPFLCLKFSRITYAFIKVNLIDLKTASLVMLSKLKIILTPTKSWTVPCEMTMKNTKYNAWYTVLAVQSKTGCTSASVGVLIALKRVKICMI
jgi:hypothetical protein